MAGFKKLFMLLILVTALVSLNNFQLGGIIFEYVTL
jgi:hypothetical protein